MISMDELISGCSVDRYYNMQHFENSEVSNYNRSLKS